MYGLLAPMMMMMMDNQNRLNKPNSKVSTLHLVCTAFNDLLFAQIKIVSNKIE